jgi:uncharacterized protein (TIGR00290 family)
MTADRMRVALSWSGGKDAAWALHELRRDPAVEVVGLVTTVTVDFMRIAMHGVRVELVRAQAKAAGLPLVEIPLPWPCSNEVYQTRFLQELARCRECWSLTRIAFGDLFLEDVRSYREALLFGTGLAPLFPLWLWPTGALIAAMLDAGMSARIVCLDPKKVPRALAGKVLDSALIGGLPSGVDPCGENGEFHTFVTRGPMLQGQVPVTSGDVVEREGFVYADLLAAK